MNTSPLATSHATATNTITDNQPPLPLADLHLPAEPSWWPLAWGWWVALALVLIMIAASIWWLQRQRRQNRAKKSALKLLTNIHTSKMFQQQSEQKKVTYANDVLRQVCLSYYPRYIMAGLHSEQWYQFLDSQSNKARFKQNQQQWHSALYQKHDIDEQSCQQLIEQVTTWVKDALPPNNRQLLMAKRIVAENDADLTGAEVA